MNNYQYYADWMAAKGYADAGKVQGFFYNNNRNGAIADDPEKFTNNINVMMWYLENRMGYVHKSACAIIGNAMYESGMNPAAWEVYHNTENGYGLFQWTPYNQFLSWPDGQYYMVCSGAGQMKRFQYEWEQRDTPQSEWTPPPAFGYPTWENFRLNQFGNADDFWSVDDLTEIFERGYLRGDPTTLPQRKINAGNIYANVEGLYHPQNPMAWLYFKMSRLNRGIKT